MVSAKKKHWVRSLYLQVIIAIVIGIALGHFYPDLGVALKPLGDGFIKLIKMVIGPIIFCTIVHGIAGMENLKVAGRVGLKAIAYFTFMTSFALVIGLVIAKLLQPGAGMNIDPNSLDISSIEHYTKAAGEQESVADFFLNIIPKTFSSAFAEGNILQVLFISILCAVVLAGMGARGKPVVHAIDTLSHLFFGVVNLIMKLAPLGALGAMAFTIGQYGLSSLASLAQLMLGFYATCILFVVLILGVVVRSCGLRLWPLLKYIREEIFIVIGTSSSESVLPRIIEKMTKLGCQESISGMVIPTGYSFNLDGTAIYLTMAALFIAQATNTDLTFAEEITLLSILLLTSKGAAGVTGSGFIVLAATLATVGHVPVAGITLILGIDRFMSEARAVTNLIGNCVATIFVAKWEKSLDITQARAVLKKQ